MRRDNPVEGPVAIPIEREKEPRAKGGTDSSVRQPTVVCARWILAPMRSSHRPAHQRRPGPSRNHGTSGTHCASSFTYTR
ncbi:hypothetical protein TNCV_3776211 [Trichonephila clavipes]|nr:hypothetical protein TNCV_3776211 [Trichonephila clavipes]